MDSRYLDLDSEESSAIIVIYNGKARSFSSFELKNLLETIDEQMNRYKAGIDRRSLASIGKILGVIRRDRGQDLQHHDCLRIGAAIDSFDGSVGGKRSSQVGFWLREMHGWNSVTPELRAKIDSFLKRYPQLEAIPKRLKK